MDLQIIFMRIVTDMLIKDILIKENKELESFFSLEGIIKIFKLMSNL